MRRKLLIGFAGWLLLIVLPSFLILRYYVEFTPTWKHVQILLLASLLCLNFLYLFFKLYERGWENALLFAAAFALVNGLYGRFFDKMDPRLHFIPLLVLMGAVTLVVRFVWLKSPPKGAR